MIFSDNFATGIAPGWSGYSLPGTETPDATDNISFVSAPWGGGDRSMHIKVGRYDYATDKDRSFKKNRIELWRDPAPGECPHGTVVWYGWRLWIPTNYSYSSSDSTGRFQIMGQWHDAHLNTGLEPPIALAYRQLSGASSLRLRYGLEGDTQQTKTVAIRRGVPNVLKFRLCFSPKSDGFVDAYLNGVLWTSLRGRNVYPEQGSVPNTFRGWMYRGFDQTQTNEFDIGRFCISEKDDF